MSDTNLAGDGTDVTEYRHKILSADTNGVPSSYGVAHRSPMGDAHIGARAKLAGLFQIRIKAGDCTNCRAIRCEKMFPRYKWAAIQLRQLHTVAHPSATGVPQNARPIWPPLYPPAAIEGTGESDGDVATVARGAVEGAMETTKSVGLRAEDMAFSIARGAIEGTK